MQCGGQPINSLGVDIKDKDGSMVCPESRLRSREIEPAVVRCLDLDEAAPLDAALTKGQVG